MQHKVSKLFNTSLLALGVTAAITNPVTAATIAVDTFADEINNNGDMFLT